MKPRRATTDALSARGAETRDRILAATRSELRKRGQDLTLDHIAARLAVTKQAVLYHFPSKDRLLVELEGAQDAMKLPFQRYADELAAALAGGIRRAPGRRRRRAPNGAGGRVEPS